MKTWNFYNPLALGGALLFWAATVGLYMMTNPIPAFGGSAQHVPRCLAQRQDAGIIAHMLTARDATPEGIKQFAMGATDIGSERKADIFELVDEAAALRALACAAEDHSCMTERTLDNWPEKVFERCRAAGTPTGEPEAIER